LKGSDTNKSKALVKGKGTGRPDLPFGSITAPLTVQLVNGDSGVCWYRCALPALALGLLTALPAFAGADEDMIAKNLETFRVAQAANKGDAIAPVCAEELSYSHSSGAVDTKASLIGLPRNALCPCGSGKKIKHCHGELTA